MLQRRGAGHEATALAWPGRRRRRGSQEPNGCEARGKQTHRFAMLPTSLYSAPKACEAHTKNISDADMVPPRTHF